MKYEGSAAAILQPSTFNLQPSTFNLQPSTFNLQPSTFNLQPFPVTIPQAFELALQHHRAGRLAEAEALYRQILAVQPNYAEALHFLGLIAHQVGNHEAAVELIRKAIRFSPINPLAYCNLGEAFRSMGQFDEAVAAYRRALELNREYPEALNNLGAAFAGLGKLDQAIASFCHALKLKPDYAEAYYNLGSALAGQENPREALTAYRRALKIKADFPEAHYNLGNVLKDLGNLDEAIAAYRLAVHLKPDFLDAHINMGNALRGRGEFDEAVATYKRALELKSDFPTTHLNLGNALKDRGQLDEALAAYRRAIELRQDYPEADNNLGNALRERGEIDQALVAYRHALQLKPDDVSACDNLIYALHYHPCHDQIMIAAEHQRWNREFSDPLKPFILPHVNERSQERRLRVGYVSPDFRDHPVGRYILPLLERHDRERFDILCYSGVARPDWMTERLRAPVAKWRSTIGVSDVQLAEIIRADKVDILVDLALHTAGNRLTMFAREPAPVQTSWLGYPGSAGLSSINYRLTDSRMDPPGERDAWSAGEPVRLPDCWCCFQPVGKYPEINDPPALSGEGLTFGSLNNFAKVNERGLALWARVMDAVMGSRLLMFCPAGLARERVLRFFVARGIAVERVKLVGLLPRFEYLSLYRRIDLGLDPFPCNGMATTCDALWIGVPVLTLPGEMPASRAGVSLLSTVRLEEFVALSEEDYVKKALEHAANIPRLGELRATLRTRMQSSPLMDAARFARNVEEAYRAMWQRWCKGLSPLP